MKDFEDTFEKDNQMSENEVVDFETKKAEEQVKSTLCRLKNQLSKEEFDDFLQKSKEHAKFEFEEADAFFCEDFTFDFDEDDFQVLIRQKHIPKLVLDLVFVELSPVVYVYATQIENPTEESQVFHYLAFVDELRQSFSEKGFEDQLPKKLEQVFKFMKKGSLENFPELELVFDKKQHKVFASLVVGEKTLVDEVEIHNLNNKCKKLNEPEIQKTVTPTLKKANLSKIYLEMKNEERQL